MRLLVIEDEKRLARNLAELLRRQGYTVDVSSDGVSGYDNASTDPVSYTHLTLPTIA